KRRLHLASKRVVHIANLNPASQEAFSSRQGQAVFFVFGNGEVQSPVDGFRLSPCSQCLLRALDLGRIQLEVFVKAFGCSCHRFLSAVSIPRMYITTKSMYIRGTGFKRSTVTPCKCLIVLTRFDQAYRLHHHLSQGPIRQTRQRSLLPSPASRMRFAPFCFLEPVKAPHGCEERQIGKQSRAALCSTGFLQHLWCARGKIRRSPRRR